MGHIGQEPDSVCFMAMGKPLMKIRALERLQPDIQVNFSAF